MSYNTSDGTAVCFICGERIIANKIYYTDMKGLNAHITCNERESAEPKKCGHILKGEANESAGFR